VKIRLAELWERCAKCLVRGTTRTTSPKICPECNGQGERPTENGMAIVELVKNITKPPRRNTRSPVAKSH